jgi:2-polyprenyl-3-methyl-5-hydroxy-6-metoxy-1,4-benzoquinol methylase
MPVEEDLPQLYETYYTHSERGKSIARVRQAIQGAYWSSYFGYADRGVFGSAVLATLLTLFPGLRAELAQQIFELPPQEGGRLLDIGCGSGAALMRMADLGWQVEGVEFDEKAVQFATSNGLDVRLGSLEQQAYPADIFDAVVMNHVIEHVWNPRALLRECRRILKPGGRLVCITPNAAAWCHALFESDWRGLEPPRHLHIFTKRSLHCLTQSSDWISLEVRSTIASTHYMAWASSKLKLDGQYSMNMRPGAMGEITTRAFQTIAAAKHVFAPECGEELVMHAVKRA